MLRARVAAQGQELEAMRRALAGALARAEGLQRLLSVRQRELEQMRSTIVGATAAIRDQLERVANSAAWRYGHAASRSVQRARGRRPLTAGGVAAAIGQADRLLEILGATPPGEDQERAARLATEPQPAGAHAPARDQELLLGAHVRERLGPVPGGDDWPSVSVVTVSRSRTLTRELIGHLELTLYPAIEVILVDNASPGGEVAELAQSGARLALGALRLDQPVSYSEACNRGAQRATGELLLFANDDIRPLEPGWLRELVTSVREGRAGIVGATLVAPDLGVPTEGKTGWRLEQRGIAIGVAHGEPTPVRREHGEEVLGDGFGTDVSAVAVSAACLLVAAATFAELGGFDSGYQYGLEDVDLCVRARAQGHSVACSGRSVVVHAGSGSQAQAGREFRRLNRAINRRRLRRLWGPELRRARLEGLMSGDRIWGAGLHLAIARTSNDPGAGWGDHYTAIELGAAANALGWRVTYLAERDRPGAAIPDDLDVAVVLTDRWDVRALPRHVLLCAWVRNWTERWLTRPWLDRYDVLLASSQQSARLLQSQTGRPVEMFPLATNPRRFSPAPAAASAGLDWVLTANRWGRARAIEVALVQRRRDSGAIYGRGWSAVKRLRGVAKGPLDYDLLANAYRSAKVVLDDTAGPALDYDALNSRVFDALACGVPVLTNCARGVHELFDDEFPTWASAAELHDQLDGLLAVPARRAELGERYRRVVLRRHTYEHRIRRLRRIVREQNDRLSFCLKVGAPDSEQAERWGDLHFARGLGRALRRAGHRWHVDLLPDWDAAESSGFDVTVHLRGRSPYAQAPGQFNVLWLISHPDSFDASLADGYDLICVASASLAASLSGRVSAPVQVLEQATDPRVFFPQRAPGVAHELVFVGNARGARRKILDDLLPTRHDLAVWGSGWRGTDAERHLQTEYVPPEELRTIYSSASIVLCDHWPDMRARGFRSNRLYDALACGALVLSDDVAGLDGSLGDAVLTYDQPSELRALIERLLADPSERARRVADARERVLARDTFDHRAAELLAWVHEELGSSGRDRSAAAA